MKTEGAQLDFWDPRLLHFPLYFLVPLIFLELYAMTLKSQIRYKAESASEEDVGVYLISYKLQISKHVK